jgi:hypothetical protein
VLLAQVELAPHAEPGFSRQRPEQNVQLALQISVPAGGCGIHVEHTVPYLVEEVLAQPPAPLEQLLELDRLGIAH